MANSYPYQTTKYPGQRPDVNYYDYSQQGGEPYPNQNNIYNPQPYPNQNNICYPQPYVNWNPSYILSPQFPQGEKYSYRDDQLNFSQPPSTSNNQISGKYVPIEFGGVNGNKPSSGGLIPNADANQTAKLKYGVRKAVYQRVFDKLIDHDIAEEIETAQMEGGRFPVVQACYFFYDRDKGYIWYVGSTNNLRIRMAQHAAGYHTAALGSMYESMRIVNETIWGGVNTFNVAYIETHYATSWEAFFLERFHFPLNTTNNGPRSTVNEMLAGFHHGSAITPLHLEDKRALEAIERTFENAQQTFEEWARK